ncbi:Holliday junction ATP-dependent DNA helicase RuvA [Flexivirga endophytica]|uniref:Holliday junction branch migration complex subunit RuvA n=1 Tax=Flexivirga endophytica TaxID=1849103 RepID=A0A916TAI6_9MICO|nr:Holliday junction branch migration protein RuvA [Flexivirga endophytica]GGB37051.1 Holliday junction ATP-dependent DNA helicase RuvA [Flexivirga endophytica]GHB44619.1 Holliday junction ATP-dependent DNA helicase RuvA [Flexivirga endophytica]
MIATLRGTVLHVGLDQVVVEVGGVGLLTHTTPGTAAALHAGGEASLSTTLVVREDALTLYGFGSGDERDLFELVQTVSGVGPRIALAMLAVASPDQIRAAIAGGDVAALVKTPGIGKKGAERIVLELKDKVGPLITGDTTDVPAVPTSGRHDQVSEALIGLGWSAKQADDAVAKVTSAEPELTEVSALLRAALRELGR